MKDYFKDKKLPRLTVDTLVRDRRGRVLLVKRGRPPFLGRWALPGGFCEYGETTAECGSRATRKRPAGSRRMSFAASLTPSTTVRSFARNWRDDGGRLLLGAFGAALLEDEALARLVEGALVPLDDGGGLV